MFKIRLVGNLTVAGLQTVKILKNRVAYSIILNSYNLFDCISVSNVSFFQKIVSMGPTSIEFQLIHYELIRVLMVFSKFTCHCSKCIHIDIVHRHCSNVKVNFIYSNF